MNYDKLSSISSCQCSGELMQTIYSLLYDVGIDSFIYISFDKNNEHIKSFRYMVGCDHKWAIEYTNRKWFSIDQFISYARCFDKPILISEYSVETRGQVDLMNHYHSHGFRSGMVIPSHCVFNNRAGVLIVGNDCVHVKGNIVFAKNKYYLREISIEILSWLNIFLQPKDIDIRQLTDIDLKLLKLSFFEENTSNDIAMLTSLTSSQVNNRFRKINKLFGVDSRRDAANVAVDLGIIHPYLS